MNRDSEPLAPRRILQVAGAVAAVLGLDATGARTIKFTNNAVVRLPRAGAVVRIPGSPAVERRIGTILTAATVLAAHGVPAVQSYPGLPQPIWAAGRWSTVWIDAQIDPSDDASEPPRPHHLARILRAVHAISGPQPFPAWQPVRSIRERIAGAFGLDPADETWLLDQCAELDEQVAGLAAIEPLIPPGLVHGDAFLGNLIPAAAGPVICDFDSTCIGPREWDLTPVAVGGLRMGYGGRVHEELAAAYGIDVTTWAGFPVLRRVRELQLVTSVLPAIAVNPRLRPQWQLRLRTLQTGDTQTRWTPYAEV